MIAELTMIGKATGNFTGRGPNGAVNVVGLSVVFASLARNEAIARATFRERGLTITLTDAALISVRHVVAGATGAYEDVTLFAHEIEFTWDATGHTAVHRCV